MLKTEAMPRWNIKRCSSNDPLWLFSPRWTSSNPSTRGPMAPQQVSNVSIEKNNLWVLQVVHTHKILLENSVFCVDLFSWPCRPWENPWVALVSQNFEDTKMNVASKLWSWYSDGPWSCWSAALDIEGPSLWSHRGGYPTIPNEKTNIWWFPMCDSQLNSHNSLA